MAHDAGLAQGIQFVALHRPGFASSTPRPTRKILDWPADVLGVADHFSIQRFVIMGFSSGGPFALAWLRELPEDRLLGIVICCGVMPGSYGIAGMRLTSRIAFTISPWVPSLVSMLVDSIDSILSAAARNEDPKALEDKMTREFQNMPPPDQALLSENVRGCRDAIIASARAALIPGGETSAIEAALFRSAWGFDVKEMQFRKGLLVMSHGTEDTDVPYHMEETASQDKPNAELRTIEGQGHLGVVLKVEGIVSVIKDMMH